MTVDELRQKYLDYFATQDHHVVPSASLVPENDPTTLFTSAGMQPMMPYLLGEPHPEGKRITDSQKCFRTQDIDEVGDNRHTTFFEMLGNWSCGDYFKAEQIPWVFNFVVKGLELDPNRLYVTCYQGNDKLGIAKDDEAAKLWVDAFGSVGVQAEIGDRIRFYGESENWWSRSGKPDAMPEGEPGGPDSEMFWDFDPDNQLKQHENSEWANEECHPNCDCGRFLEIGNSVFMEYMKTKSGFEPLTNKNIDFGGGLERMVAAVNDDPDIFNIDVFAAVKQELEEMSGQEYNNGETSTHAFRVILDHLRAATFLIADGAVPSNKDQGYFTRRLIRRAVRYGSQLGIQGQFTAHLAELYIEAYRNSYPELLEFKDRILKELDDEEIKFGKTLERGLKILEDRIEKAKKELEKKVHQKEKRPPFAVRWRPDFGSKSADFINMLSGKEAFDIYQSYGFPPEMISEELAKYGMGFHEGEFDEEMKKHQQLSAMGAEQKFKGGLADSGEMSVKYHTATHLLHEALRKVLGDHVEQRGSNITEQRLRFDFSHGEKMTDEQKIEVEKIVNEAIEADLPVAFEEMTVEEAKAAGAIGLFGDKYGEKVKVYSIGDFSKEICGGPHVEQTGQLGQFKIKKEQASSAGVRRIKAVLN